MARDKKGKKERDEEVGEVAATKKATNESHDVSLSNQPGKTRKNRKKGDDDDESITQKLSEINLNADSDTVANAGKKSKKPKDIGNGDVDEDKNLPSDRAGVKDTKKKKKSKKEKAIDSDDDDDNDITDVKDTESTTTSKKNARTKKKNRATLSSDDEDNDNDSEVTKPPPAEKSKKKKTKKSGFELLEIEDDMIAVGESQKQEVEEPSTPLVKAELSKPEMKSGKKSKKKERKKKDDDDEDDIDKVLEELRSEMNLEAAPPTAQILNEPTKDVETEEAKQTTEEVKSGKKKKAKKEQTEIKKELSEEKDAEVEDEVSTMKTAAQKKKEKKENEKKKKQAQFEKEQASKPATNTEVKKQKTQPKKPTLPKELPEVVAEDDEEDADDSKKKKKKKKDDKDDKKEKKRPGKKQIAAMQEALKSLQEEQERLRLEEEARIQAEEEAERLRQENLRLEQEKKDKKKQKEKEKRERLKAEGKLLSKAQRQNKARMEATLAALREQGVDVPQVGEKKERIPRLGDRKRQPRKKTDPEVSETKDEEFEVSPEPENEDPNEQMEVDNAQVAAEEEEEEEDDDVKDAWDESSDEDESKNFKSPKKFLARHNKTSSAESSEESDSEETDESDSEDSDSEEESSESETENKRNEEKVRERAIERIRKRIEENETKRSTTKLRSPVVCVLGHVDTGKTKILDKIRRTNVQSVEAGGITQQIGATMVPQEALKDQCKMAKNFTDLELKVPGLLIIDTPGHESFSNLRSRGSSLCDIAILVVDIMHGLEPQTLESINLLKVKKTPFIVALNKVDRLYEWKSIKNKDIHDVVKGQARNTKMEFEDRAKDIILQFANQGLNAMLSYENSDPRTYISMVPTSAMTGDGMGNLLSLVVELTQQLMAKRIAFSEELQATVLEVKAIPGLGTTVDAILVNGRLREGDTMVIAGYEGPVVTQIRSLLMPQPLKELRVKNPYQEYKEVEGAQGVKITGKDLDKTIAGLQLLVANHPDEVPILKEEVSSALTEAMSSIKLAERGVYVQASTLGSLEALLDFLRTSKIPYSGIRIGPVVKKDVMKASIMLEHESQYAVILAFDVKVERDAQELADSLGVKIFQADIIYHLFDKFTAYREELKNKKREEMKNIAVFPCKLRILPQFVFNSRDPIVVGVIVDAGIVKNGTPLCVPSKDFLDIGTVTTIEVNHKAIESARKGQEVCIKIEPLGGDAPKMYGRHFDHTDLLVSKITRQSIDVCKEHFRDDLQKTDWQLMVELKKTFEIL